VVIYVLDKLIIRRATNNDCTILNKLFEKLLIYERTYFDKNISQDLNINSFFENRVNDNNCVIFVAEIDNRVIGYISGYIDHDNKIKVEIETIIESIYIEDNYKNKGIGTKLINEFIKCVKEKGVKYILIDNFILNESARYLYKKLGFIVLKESRRMEI